MSQSAHLILTALVARTLLWQQGQTYLMLWLLAPFRGSLRLLRRFLPLFRVRYKHIRCGSSECPPSPAPRWIHTAHRSARWCSTRCAGRNWFSDRGLRQLPWIFYCGTDLLGCNPVCRFGGLKDEHTHGEGGRHQVFYWACKRSCADVKLVAGCIASLPCLGYGDTSVGPGRALNRDDGPSNSPLKYFAFNARKIFSR